MFSQLHLTGPCLRRWNIPGVGHPVSAGLTNRKTKVRLEKKKTSLSFQVKYTWAHLKIGWDSILKYWWRTREAHANLPKFSNVQYLEQSCDKKEIIYLRLLPAHISTCQALLIPLTKNWFYLLYCYFFRSWELSKYASLRFDSLSWLR